MKHKTLVILSSAILALSLSASVATPVSYDLNSFDFVFSGIAPTTSDSSTKPTSLVIDTHEFTPSLLGDGERLELSMTIAVNQSAATWTLDGTGNLITMGLVKDNGITSLFDASHDSDAVLWFQNNQNDGTGIYWNNKFYSGGTSGTFVFGDGGQGAGVVNDNADHTGPLGGSLAHYLISIAKDGSYTMTVSSLDPNGNSVLDQYLTGTVDPNATYVSAYRARAGNDNPGNWSITSSNATVSVVPEPSAYGVVFGCSLFVLVAIRSRQRIGS